MFIIKIVFKYNSYTGVITQRQQFPVEVERSDVRRESWEQPVTSAPLAQLALDRYFEPGTAFRYADQKPYFARLAASLPRSLLNVLGDLHFPFFTCIFHSASFILVPSLFVLIPALRLISSNSGFQLYWASFLWRFIFIISRGSRTDAQLFCSLTLRPSVTNKRSHTRHFKLDTHQ